MTRQEIEEAALWAKEFQEINVKIALLHTELKTILSECKHWTSKMVPTTDDKGRVTDSNYCEWCSKLLED